MRNSNLLLALVIGLLAAQASLAATYKWVDADGNVVYSQTKPPAGTPTQEVKKRSFGTTDQDAQDELQRLRDKSNSPEKDREIKQKVAAEQSDHDRKSKENCDISRKNLSLLQSPSRITLTDPDGNQYFPSDEEKAGRISKAEDDVAEYCE